MAAAVVERMWRDSAPESVEQDLAELWRGVSAHGTVARAVMSNLVVFRFHERRHTRDDGTRHSLDAVLEAVIAQHPSRVIVIDHERDVRDVCAVEPSIGAGVGVWIFGPPAARYAVEQVVVHSACTEASLPSVVRRFVRGDLPTSIWWTEDISQLPPLPALVGMCRQLVYDSRSWRDVRAGFRALSGVLARGTCDVADLNWRRLLPVRRALGQASSIDIAPGSIRVAHRAGDAALAWLLAGWLVVGLERDAGRRGEWPSVAALDAGDDQHLTVTIGTTSLQMNDRQVVLTQAGAAPLVVPVPADDTARGVAAELQSLADDSALRDVLIALGTLG